MTGVLIRRVTFGNIETLRYRDWSIAATSKAMHKLGEIQAMDFFLEPPEGTYSAGILILTLASRTVRE